MTAPVRPAPGEAEAPAPVPVVVEQPRLPSSVHVAIIGIFLIMLVAALYLARAVVLPIVLAGLLSLTAAPLVRRLARLGVPPAVSAVLFVAVVALVVGGAATLVRDPIADMVKNAPEFARTVRDKIDVLRQPFALLSQATQEVERAASPPPPPAGTAGPDAAITVVDHQSGLLEWLIGTLADTGSTIIATLLLTPFLLASSESLKLKLIRAVPLLSAKKKSLRVLYDIEQRVSQFLVTAAMLNAGLGVLVGSAMAILGMPNPILWGVGAALLNFVPYVGPLTGISLAALVSLATHNDFGSALLPPIAYAALNGVEATVVTPWVMGRRLSLSIVAILLAVALTTWMWGIIGTFIGVPLLVAVKVFCEEFPPLAHIGLFISAESEPIEENGEEAAAHTAEASGQPATLAATPPVPVRSRL